MGFLDNVLGSKHKVSRSPTHVAKEPKYLELDWKGAHGETREYVRVLNLNDFSDVESVLDHLRDRNNILILKIKPRLVQEKLELKRALKRIQRTCQAIGGDIVGVREDIILITPPEVEVVRTTASAAPSALETEEEPIAQAA